MENTNPTQTTETRSPSRDEIIESIKTLVHVGFGQLPKNAQNALHNWHIMSFLDALAEVAKD